ncbi:MAG: calcium/sodium antiporter [Candidatus Diapherotrites archaeon]|nr:calcium/sodium antiporter [Candidatus Diapherotrites archaeon]
MIPELLVLAGSLAALVVFSNVVIHAAMKIADYLKIGEFALGFIAISIFTSLPELVVALTAAYTGEVGIAIGNVLGSNITNILLVLGLAVAIKGVRVKRKELMENAEILLLITFAPLIFFLRGSIGFYEGLLLLLLFALYVFFVAKRDYRFELTDHVRTKDWVLYNAKFWFGMVLVVIAAQFVVGSAASLAAQLMIPESTIAVTIIALGTSLPELAIAIGAVKKGHTNLALGEVLGSNVVNITLVLGAAALLNPLSADYETFASTIAFLVGVSLLLWYLLVKHTRLSRRHGVMFVLLYAVFLMMHMFIKSV